MINQMIKVH